MKEICSPLLIGRTQQIILDGVEWNVIQGVEIEGKDYPRSNPILKFEDRKSEIQSVRVKLAHEWFSDNSEKHDHYLLELNFHEGQVLISMVRVSKEESQ